MTEEAEVLRVEAAAAATAWAEALKEHEEALQELRETLATRDKRNSDLVE